MEILNASLRNEKAYRVLNETLFMMKETIRRESMAKHYDVYRHFLSRKRPRVLLRK